MAIFFGLCTAETLLCYGIAFYFPDIVLAQDQLIEPNDRVDRRTDFMAHAGKEMVFRPVQLLNLLFLLLGDGVFLFIHPVQEHEDYAGEQPNHNHGKGGIKKGVAMDVGRDDREPCRNGAHCKIQHPEGAHSNRGHGNHAAAAYAFSHQAQYDSCIFMQESYNFIQAIHLRPGAAASALPGFAPEQFVR